MSLYAAVRQRPAFGSTEVVRPHGHWQSGAYATLAQINRRVRQRDERQPIVPLFHFGNSIGFRRKHFAVGSSTTADSALCRKRTADSLDGRREYRHHAAVERPQQLARSAGPVQLRT